MKQKILSKSVYRYILAGIVAYSIELSVLLSLKWFVGLSVEFATAIAFWVGLIASFILQKFFAFKDFEKTVKSISRQLGVFLALVAVNYIFTLTIVTIFPSRMIVFSRTLALMITTFWNFIIYKRFIFKPKAQTPQKKLSFRKILSVNLIKKSLINKRVGMFLLLSSVVVLFFWQYWAPNRNRSLGGDFDYYSQLYEAFRVSVLKYHQFPLWNPWMSGGVPLFANPQFGAFSIQSIFVIFFGAIYGLRLSFIFYGIMGFWGMYILGRRVLLASKLRSILVGYIWVFGGFFAGHNVSHLTFTSFFLLPWLLYFIAERKRRFSWLWLGVTESVIILSSVHYAFLMLTLAIAIYFVISLSSLKLSNKELSLRWQLKKEDLFFVLKSSLSVALLAGYQLYHTYHFVSANQRLTDSFTESPNTITLFFKFIFLPIGSLIKSYPKTTWGWGEYTMYVGIGTGLSLIVCFAVIVYGLVLRTKKDFISNRKVVFSILVVGLFCASIALGDFGARSPFYMLHSLPGFTQTRTPTRWLIVATFSILVFLLAWKPNKKIINVLLFLSVLELFLTNGPPRKSGQYGIEIPTANFSNTFTQYDNGRVHIDLNGNHDPLNSYYYTTASNIGQIYADDSIINTKSGVKPLATHRCGINTSTLCSFVMSSNATVSYWSPNKIILQRTSPGPIELNMNVEQGWRVNNIYPFVLQRGLEPSEKFILPAGQQSYALEYSPKLSPSWIVWRAEKQFRLN